ncbi:hypothetical protein FOTG_18477 [Fusarium oxysporum f. sp. vasinfectum 25433]|uniref:Kinetochore protein mis13 n=1 Tax=Fusarium oxysporum f. sp. vasinfectum 25433 TaxID=1089449 RepID=X0KWJ4_FUSOX|nr:hypothetical protein FOTG_18477 [Fusarium oxysporum f. sp. vasinfectum 25433]
MEFGILFDVSRGLWSDLGNYLCVEETSMALNEGPSSSAENEDEERTGNNDEDDLDPEGKADDDDDELDHDDPAYGSDQGEFSKHTYTELRVQADGELDTAAFDNFLELLYEQLERLNEIRADHIVLGSQSPWVLTREINVPKRPSTSRSTRRIGEAQEEEAPQPAPTSPIIEAPKKRESRAKPPRPLPDWDKSPQRKPPVYLATVALPVSDTPIINRNKEMPKKEGNSNSRSSLGNSGRRASSLIESDQTAIPHQEVNPADFYKHIEAEGLTEPRRMKQLLTWCGERALAWKPPHGTPNSNAIVGARAIQDQLLKDFVARSEFSDWFRREDDAPKVPAVLRPNPQKHGVGRETGQTGTDETNAWQAIRNPLPEQPPLFSEGETGDIVLPDFDLLDPDEGKIRGFLADGTTSFDTVRSETESRLRTIQSSLEFQVDQLPGNVHKLEQRVLVAGKEANKVLSVSALRLRQREEWEKASAGTRDMPVIEVLRSLGSILPEGGG